MKDLPKATMDSMAIYMTQIAEEDAGLNVEESNRLLQAITKLLEDFFPIENE